MPSSAFCSTWVKRWSYEACEWNEIMTATTFLSFSRFLISLMWWLIAFGLTGWGCGTVGFLLLAGYSIFPTFFTGGTGTFFISCTFFSSLMTADSTFFTFNFVSAWISYFFTYYFLGFSTFTFMFDVDFFAGALDFISAVYWFIKSQQIYSFSKIILRNLKYS